MFEKLAPILTVIAIFFLLIAGITKEEAAVLAFLILYGLAMVCWGIAWLRKRRDQRRNQQAQAKKSAATSTKTVKADEPLVTLRSPDSGDWCDLKKEGDVYQLTLYRDSGSVLLRKVFDPKKRRYLFSGLCLCLKTEGWPRWVMEGLYRWGGMSMFVSDQGEMPTEGRVYWQFRGDEVYFELHDGMWSVHSGMKKFSAALPGVTDWEIVRCLGRPVNFFYEHMNDFTAAVTGEFMPTLLLEHGCDSGHLTVHTTEDPATIRIEHLLPDGSIAHREMLTVETPRPPLSAVMFRLHMNGWPAWTLQRLAQWKDITRFTYDSAAPDRPGRVFWQNAGDLSHYSQVLFFEKVSGQWQLDTGFGSARPLPGATDEDILRYLRLSPDAFWQNPAILDKLPQPEPVPAPEKPEKTEAAPVQPTRSEIRQAVHRDAMPHSADRNELRRYRMSEKEQTICAAMEQKLDQALKVMGANRDFIDQRHCATGKPRFGYADKQGYFYVLQPERMGEVVPALHPNENVFLAELLNEAAYYQDHALDPDSGLVLVIKNTWGGRAEHGFDRLVVLHKPDGYALNLFSWHLSDEGGQSRMTGYTLRSLSMLTERDRIRLRPSAYLFHETLLRNLPGWVAEKLMQKKAFTDLFLPPTQEEKPGQVYWCNAGDTREHWIIWFEKQNGVWHACSRIRRPDVRMEKQTPLPQATARDIDALLKMDPETYIQSPDIQHWYRRDYKQEITLYEQTSQPSPDDEVRLRYAIDPRCGALYCCETILNLRAQDARSSEKLADYGELTRLDARYEGMASHNWRKYLPSDDADIPQKDLRESAHKRFEGRASVKKAMVTFSEADQQRFHEQLYQYDQDVNRGGSTREQAAASRDLVFVDGAAVPREVAERMQALAAKPTAKGKPVELYRHDRRSFYDEESSVQLARKSPESYTLLTLYNTPNAGDHTVYDLPPHMAMLGCTRGEILTWLKEQRCVISFPEKDLADRTVVIPRPALIMAETLPEKLFGKRRQILQNKFFPGSNSQHRVALYRQDSGVGWLHSSAFWRSESGPHGDLIFDAAFSDENDRWEHWREESLLKLTRQAPTAAQATIAQEIRLYKEEIDLSCFGKAEKELYRWHSTSGHDSQSWDCRTIIATLHQAGGRRYVIDRTLWIDGTTQEHRWVTTILTLREGKEQLPIEDLRRLIQNLPQRTM